jgi:Meiotically up-regulated gene 113
MNKQHIIAEIKRTARENGGLPLGGERFLKETGIRQSDWIGKFWIRWSDALRDAGFEPNKKRTTIDHAMLLEKLIALIRELGHFPVTAELKMKGTQDPTFPNHKTFFSRFGLKAQLVATVRAYCEARNGYEDVIGVCAVMATGVGDSDQEVRGADSAFGFVYLMKAGKNYKIGRSNSVGRREYELGILLPDPPTTVHKIKTDDPAGIEAYWHGRFAAKRMGGEWFELEASDVSAFKRRKFM